MTSLSDIWLAEYSVLQGAFHVETALEAAEKNVRQIVLGQTNSFLPFGFYATRREALAACRALGDLMARHGGRPVLASEVGRACWPVGGADGV
jgi:hypothetical protein